MRAALVTTLLVLQYAAQLPCRTVTRASRTSLRALPPAASSHEDLESIISRNREITDLLIPLLEANLEAKRTDQNKRNDLLKAFSYRGAARKDPVVKLLPLPKHKSRERKTPLAFILASELRSRKGKKGRSKVHAQKAFLIQNENRVSSSEEEYEDITQKLKEKSTLSKRHHNKNTVEDSESNQSGEDYDIDIRNEHKNQITSNESNENHQNAKTRVKENGLTKETQEESDDITEEDKKKESKENHRKTKSVRLNLSVSSNSDEYDENHSSESSTDDEVEHNKHAESHGNSNTNEVNSKSDDASENQESERLEENPKHYKKVLARSHEHSGESEDDFYKPAHVKEQEDQTLNTDSYKISRELVVVDLSNEKNKHSADKNSPEENNVSKGYSETDETKEKDESHSKTDPTKNRSSENSDLSNENVSSEHKNENDDDDKSKQLSEGSVSNTSEENKTSEDHNEEGLKSSDYDHVSNQNDNSEPGQYVNDYVDVSDYHENVKNESYEEVYDEDEDHKATNENNNSASHEDNLDEEHNTNLDAEYENRSDDFDNQSGNDVETEHDIDTQSSVETSEEDTPTEEDDMYTDEWVDDELNSVESRKNPNRDLGHIKKQVTFSDEIADKYAVDSKYTVEDDRSLLQSSELAKFHADSVEGLIEVQQDEGNKDKKKKCNENEENGSVSEERRAGVHSHDVHKSYKLSFKFNK